MRILSNIIWDVRIKEKGKAKKSLTQKEKY